MIQVDNFKSLLVAWIIGCHQAPIGQRSRAFTPDGRAAAEHVQLLLVVARMDLRPQLCRALCM